jgi:hypothetical protein
MRRLLLVAGIACLLGFQTPGYSTAPKPPISMLNVQVSELKDQLLLTSIKLDEINNNLADLRTTMTLIQWIGGSLGLLILGLLWKIEFPQIRRRPNGI